MEKVVKYRGCGQHGLVKGSQDPVWLPWCLACQFLPDRRVSPTKGQLVAKRMRDERQERLDV